MTFRARPVARRRGRAGWDAGDRRNSLINAGFFLAIGISVLILLGYAAWSWYDTHFGAAATVEGKVITKDDLRNRIAIENFRLDYVESRIQTLMAKGRMTASDGAQQLDFVSQRRQQLADLTLQRLVDISLMTKLAAENGVEVTPADVDAQVTEEATEPAERHSWMIEVEPSPDPKTGQIGDEQKRTALGNAQRALARLKHGESWDDVAKTVSTSGNAPQAGDLGWITKDTGYDPKFMDAVFASPLNQPTDVITGDDGTYRIGRATEEAAAEVDPTLQTQVEDAKINFADFRAALSGDALRKKLDDKIVADLGKPGTQRHVLEIKLPEPNTSSVGTEPGVKTRWIVYAPDDDMAKARTLPADDPAWAAAKAQADAAYTDLKAHPDKFDATARAGTDELSGRDTGGKQPWIYPSTPIDTAIKNAVLADGLQDGQLLEPVKGEAGYYVIQYMRGLGEGEDTYLKTLKDKATDDATFRQLAIDNSETEGAKDGGDAGWIAKDQLDEQLDNAVFGTAIGQNSDVVTVSGDGSYLYRVLGEETRQPTDEQLKIFKDSGFNNWYTRQKEAAKITYNIGTNAGTGGTG